MDDPASQFVVVGKIASAYGIKGWVKINSFTDPLTNILEYQPWYLRSRGPDGMWEPVKIITGRIHGKQVVAQLEGCTDRNQAELLRGLEIAVTRDQLPETADGQYYWVDLEGLTVVNLQGVNLGQVDSVMETGANDVLVVKGDKQRLIPYVVDEVIRDVDLDAGRIIVDWDPEF